MSVPVSPGANGNFFFPIASASLLRADALFGDAFMYSFIVMLKRYIMYFKIASKTTNCVIDSLDTKSIISNMKWYEFAKQLMKEQGIKQEDLMTVFGVATRGAVGHYLSGRRSVTAEQFKSLSDRLGVSMDDLFSAKVTYSLCKEITNLPKEKRSVIELMINALNNPETTPAIQNKPLTKEI
jgi:transcriptional regulator with XRE-family HTH domain